MIDGESTYRGSLSQLKFLEEWLNELVNENRPPPDLVRLSVRRQIADLQVELGHYEARVESPTTVPIRTKSATVEMNSMAVQEVVS